jgi:methionyl-tRNA formyltransferase
MPLSYAYLGSTTVSKEILQQLSIDPGLVISFTDNHRDKVSNFATYESYGDRWTQIDSINSQRGKNTLREYDPDIVLVMAWQELLDTEALDIPAVGCVGRHLALLPKRRGRAPVAWALIHGLNETGVTLFWLDEGVDDGDIITQQRIEISWTDEAHDLHAKMTTATVKALNTLFPKFESGNYPRTPQDDSKATYTHPRRPDMGLIDWTKSATHLYNFIRGQTHPYPGAFTYHKMDKITVWHASIQHRTQTKGQPGEVLAVTDTDTILIQTGEGTLEIEIETPKEARSIEKGSVFGSLP